MTERPDLSGRTIGFIGLGIMGRPMSRHLHQAGATMVVWNRSPGPREEMARLGMTPAASPREMAERADAIILMVADTPAVEAVLFGPDGVLEGLRPGGLVIDMGTTAVTPTRRFAARVAEAGGHYVDAPVSGGQPGAEQARLTIMAGGDDDAFARARPLFEVMGTTITHVGGVGAGQVAKAANQVIVGLNIGAVAEAMALAVKEGVDPERLRTALMGGFAGSKVLEVHGERMIRHDFQPGGKVTTQRKDLSQALDLAGELGMDLPATRLNMELYDRLIAKGDGGLDHSALVRLYGWDDED